MSIRDDVAAALEAEGLTPDAARTVAGRIPDGEVRDLWDSQRAVKDAGRAMTDAGLPPSPLQIAVFRRAFAVIIGGGGKGPDTSIPQCPYCLAYGGGGHGGFCPNWKAVGP